MDISTLSKTILICTWARWSTFSRTMLKRWSYTLSKRNMTRMVNCWRYWLLIIQIMFRCTIVIAHSSLVRIYTHEHYNQTRVGCGIDSWWQQDPRDQRHEASLPGRARAAPTRQFHSQRGGSFPARSQRVNSRHSPRNIRRKWIGGILHQRNVNISIYSRETLYDALLLLLLLNNCPVSVLVTALRDRRVQRNGSARPSHSEWQLSRVPASARLVLDGGEQFHAGGDGTVATVHHGLLAVATGRISTTQPAFSDHSCTNVR